MNLRKLARLEKRVPELATRALAAAQRRAVASGQTVLVVKEDGLYERKPSGEYRFVEPIRPRAKVTQRVKHALS